MKDKDFLDTNIFVYSVDSSPGQRKKRGIRSSRWFSDWKYEGKEPFLTCLPWSVSPLVFGFEFLLSPAFYLLLTAHCLSHALCPLPSALCSCPQSEKLFIFL
jgi:hypothetical protein